MKHAPGFLKLVNEARANVKECTVADVKVRMDRGDRFHPHPAGGPSRLAESEYVPRGVDAPRGTSPRATSGSGPSLLEEAILFG